MRASPPNGRLARYDSGTGSVPPEILQVELSHLAQTKSPALPHLLAAALTLEERHAGAIPFQHMFAVKAANNIPRPADDPKGEFDWTLYPVADAAVKTFRALARLDRPAALSLAETFDRRHFRVAAALGVYSAPAR